MPAKGTKDEFAPVRWTLERACSEWGINPRTLAAYVKQLGIVPGEDGKFSTTQIDAAIHGDIDGEKLRKTREEADEIALRNAGGRREVIDVNDFNRRQEAVMSEIRRIVLCFPATDEQKDELLNAFARLYLEPPKEQSELEGDGAPIRQVAGTAPTPDGCTMG